MKNTEEAPLTKKEALGIISRLLRTPGLEVHHLIKLIALQSKIGGWEKNTEPNNDTNLEKLVAAVEKKRKEAQQD